MLKIVVNDYDFNLKLNIVLTNYGFNLKKFKSIVVKYSFDDDVNLIRFFFYNNAQIST